MKLNVFEKKQNKSIKDILNSLEKKTNFAETFDKNIEKNIDKNIRNIIDFVTSFMH